MCSGSGCIGLSVFNQSKKIANLVLAEINPRQIHAIKNTIKINRLPRKKIMVYESNSLDNVPKRIFDLISRNHPLYVKLQSEFKEDWRGTFLESTFMVICTKQ